jgi:hypothetical protein
MNIDQQIQKLIDEAPQYGASPTEIQAIAPALKAIAGQLQHPQYYILQSLEQNWLVTTLTHRTDPNQTKSVIHAFPTLQDATTNARQLDDSQLLALPIPTIYILFQMLAMKPIDSIIFFETPGDYQMGVEITRQIIEEILRLSLQKAEMESQVPPDIA